MNRIACSLALFVLATASVSHAQTETKPCPNPLVQGHGKPAAGQPLASPAASAETQLDGKTVSIKYNAPSIRCRTIMGGLVPYGKLWRLGANAATTLVTDTDLTIGDLKVPAGTYTLYALPAAEGAPWQLIVNKQNGQWGTVYNESQDLGRTPMETGTLPQSQETMTLSFESVKGKNAVLHMRWEKTDVSVPVVAD
ncbi:MAG: DUF2911 domain-containing protein [Acidobacteriaceae bacterium]|nr:DUF2911 domain-containing protein [Acidobacteriaceae bacterium]